MRQRLFLKTQLLGFLIKSSIPNVGQKLYWIYKPVYRVTSQLKKLVNVVVGVGSWGEGWAWQYQSYTSV